MAQWLDRIKLGNGHNGSPSGINGAVNTYGACTGTLAGTSLTTAMPANAGDVIVIHQTQGTGAGQWELNYVLADAGTTLTLAYPLAFNYVTGAQCVLVPQYTGGIIDGAITGSAWNGSSGGIIALMCNGDVTISGTIISNGGFRGGPGRTDYAYAGEGNLGVSGIVSNGNPNGNGGGGGHHNGVQNNLNVGGGAGSNATAGTSGIYNSNSGGNTVGLANLTILFLGGGGGGTAHATSYGGNNATGAVGGGIVIVFARNVSVTGTVSVNGANAVSDGSAPTPSYSGAGAAGDVLFKCQSCTFGANKVTAKGGLGYEGYSIGGDGHIHIDYADSYAGTTNPTVNALQVNTLKQLPMGGII